MGPRKIHDDVLVTESKYQCRRGYELYTLTLEPRNSKPQALLVWHHGFSEHCSRHTHVLQELVHQCNIMVVTYDCHGHGHSGPTDPNLRAYIRTWHDLRNDMIDVLDHVAVPAAVQHGIPKERTFLGGHSMGGLTAVLVAQHRPGTYAGLLLSSPLVCVQPNQSWSEWAQIQVLRILGLLIPTTPLLPRKSAAIGMRDPASVEECLNDPLWYREPIKTGTVVSCINGTQALKSGLHKMQEPIYLQQGTHDATCSVLSLRRLLPHFGSRDVTYFEVQGGYHDLAHDPETPQCIARMVQWLREHMGGANGHTGDLVGVAGRVNGKGAADAEVQVHSVGSSEKKSV